MENVMYRRRGKWWSSWIITKIEDWIVLEQALWNAGYPLHFHFLSITTSATISSCLPKWPLPSWNIWKVCWSILQWSTKSALCQYDKPILTVFGINLSVIRNWERDDIVYNSSACIRPRVLKMDTKYYGITMCCEIFKIVLNASVTTHVTELFPWPIHDRSSSFFSFLLQNDSFDYVMEKYTAKNLFVFHLHPLHPLQMTFNDRSRPNWNSPTLMACIFGITYILEFISYLECVPVPLNIML